MSNRVVYDTNQLLDHPDLVLEGNCAVSFETLRELDALKRKPEVKFMAQQAIKALKLSLSKGIIEVLGAPTKETLDPRSPDERIILDCINSGYSFSTQDIGAQVIAEAVGVPVVGTTIEEDYDKNYVGYTYVVGDVNYESEYTAIKEMQKIEFEAIFDISLKENQYAIVDRVVDKEDLWIAKGNSVYRTSQTMKPYKAAGIMDTPLDSVQMAALDAIFDKDIPLTIIDGPLGSGKTVLSLMAAIARTKGQHQLEIYDKVCVTRPNITTDRRFERGFLPGDARDKDAPWVSGITSNLKFLFEKTKKAREEKAGDLIFDELFDIIALETIQGLSLNNSILLVDEFQLLDRDGLLLVLGRIAQGSKVVLIGDTRSQTYHINRGNEGYKLLLRHYGKHPLINFIRLDKVYRSKLAEFVSELMQENI